MIVSPFLEMLKAYFIKRGFAKTRFATSDQSVTEMQSLILRDKEIA
jgi:hypothetical protein